MRLKKDEELEMWKKRINFARINRQPYERDWKYWEGMYDDDIYGVNPFSSRMRRTKPNDPTFIPQVNELETIITNVLPKIHFNTPVFDISTDFPDLIYTAAVYELLASKLYDILDMYSSNKEILLDALLLGGGLHKTGFWYDVETSEYMLGDGTANEPYIKNEMVMSSYVTPLNFLWDYRFNTWKEKRWIAEEILKPLEEVKDSDLYDNTKDLIGNVSSTTKIEGISRKDQNNNDLVKLIEIHDLVKGRVITIVENYGKFLRNDDDYGIEIYTNLEFTPTRPRRFYGKSLAQSIEEHIIRLSKANFFMDMDSENAGIHKWLVDSSTVPAAALRSLHSHDNNVEIPIPGIASGQEPIRELKSTPQTFNWMQVQNIVRETIRGLSGSTMQERGTHEPGVETLGEVSMLMEASDTRNKERALLFSRFIESTMSKMLMIASSHMTPEKICDLVGIPPEDSFRILPFDRMRLNVKFGSTAIEARNLMLSKVMMLAKMAGGALNPEALVRMLMEALGLDFRQEMMLMTPPATPGVGTPAAQNNNPSVGGSASNTEPEMQRIQASAF